MFAVSGAAARRRDLKERPNHDKRVAFDAKTSTI